MIISFLLKGILIGLLFGIPLVAGVFIGTCIWWRLLSAVVVFLKRKTGK